MKDRVDLRKRGARTFEVLPDSTEDEFHNRTFLWIVLSTLIPDGWKSMLEDARAARWRQSEDNNDEFIEIHPDYLNRI